MYLPFPAVSACSKNRSNKHPTKRPYRPGPWPAPSLPFLLTRLPSPPQNSIRENFKFGDDRLHQIFPKTLSPEIFPGTFTKKFPAHAMNARFAISQKFRIASFARIPASNHLMQPTLKTGTKKQPFLSFRHSPAHPENDRLSKRC